ncbi:MAG TPA: long-chain fatty acid--CoA ligase [Gaiellaceae bacterium]|nr:long-chain fatty acid--CoA ligase [Gaiellaceae bacterium]
MALDTQAAPDRTAPEPGQRRTIGRLWRDAVAQRRETPAYLVEHPEGWRPVSWPDAERTVDEVANGLLELGVKKGDAFAISARSTHEWAVFDFALGLIGAIGAAVYPSSSTQDAVYIVEHSESVGAFCEDEEQLAKLASVELAHRLTYADMHALRERGRAYAREHPQALAAAEAAVGEDDLFTYIYTSGTTGPPKGCMIRHRNYYEMCRSSAEAGSFMTGDTLLLFLPLAHNFGRLAHLLGPHLGYTIAFCPDPLRVVETLPAVRPTVFPSVPRVYEKVHTAVQAKFAEATGARARLIDWALGVGRQVSVLRQRGKPVPRGLAVKHRIADRLVFAKVKARLGGRLRVAISGGAPLAREVAEFFHMLDILILEGYGLTECTTGATVNRPDRFRFGTVGPALPGVELRLAADGELLISSPTVFAGYLKDEGATRAVLDDDGWLHTGDVATIDADGFVKITDRMKDILITAGGKNVAPQDIENALKASRFISHAIVVGDRRPYIAALITLDEPEVASWAAEQGIDTDPSSFAASEPVQALIQEAVDAANDGRSTFGQVRRFAILPRDFTADENEITPTLKLKRSVCEEHFAGEIERLYDSA